ncbi:MAG: sugar ABC transporter ATP-binding protein [Christensenellaceae bacterium]|jgi:ABC-type sugar transport system ATPase subunit
MDTNNKTPIMQIRGVSKTFPGVKALNKVDMDLYAGEVLAICGENGAGKSTLMKCIAGIQPVDKGEGEYLYQGKQVNFTNPLEARDEGIVLIFQELSLVPDLSVAENIFLGSLPHKKSGLIDTKTMHAKARDILTQIQCDVSTKEPVKNLPIAQQQMVEIARALAFNAKVVIFDEPTSSLTDKEKDVLFENIRRLKANNVGIIYITHKMDEVFEISDRITVFRDGSKTGDLVTDEATIDDITQLMIGRKLDAFFHKSHAEITDDKVLEVENLTIDGIFKDISFSIRKGEIVGLYGLVGAGRSEIAESIFGVRKLDRGHVKMNGKQVHIRSSADAVKHGIGLVPENRKEQGLVLRMNCTQNISMPQLKNMTKRAFLDPAKENRLFEEYREKLSIMTPGGYQKCVFLSGGNQQKVIIGKWIATHPKLLILDEPTKGIDVGSKAEIHKLIATMAEDGLAILVISSEMPEIMGVSNRILTMSNGQINGAFERDEITEENLIKAITQVSTGLS